MPRIHNRSHRIELVYPEGISEDLHGHRFTRKISMFADKGDDEIKLIAYCKSKTLAKRIVENAYNRFVNSIIARTGKDVDQDTSPPETSGVPGNRKVVYWAQVPSGMWRACKAYFYMDDYITDYYVCESDKGLETAI